ncbi:MAG TPA: M23 family metallopeptidase [Dehalococcoidia bacterium]|nr:M23 family metallopeptidase [Dehalococcoidia bacterium]
MRQRERPPTILECALAAVTASLAVASVLLAVAGSARASGPETGALLPEGAYLRAPATAVSSLQAAPLPAPARVPTATPTPTPEPLPTPAPRFMPMPVEGTWKVACGYRCGQHDDAHASTFALDIVRADGQTAGQPVRSPVDGRIIAIVDTSSYVCDGQVVTGPAAGGVVILEFPGPSGVAWRLRLAHLDSATIPEGLKPSGRPVPVSAGTLLGTVAALDRCSHLHVSLTSMEGEREVPQPLTVAGQLLADCGVEDCWRGATLPPAAP